MSMPLYLIVKKKWFDMLVTGEKTEEYREITPYWDKRLFTKTFNLVLFRNGYQKNAPRITMKLKSIRKGIGKPEWGAPKHEVYILELASIGEIK